MVPAQRQVLEVKKKLANTSAAVVLRDGGGLQRGE